MADGLIGGIYDDKSNAWHIQFLDGGETRLYHAGSEKLNTLSTGVYVTGNLILSGTVDGRDVATDGTKLDTYPDTYTKVTEW